MIDLFHSGFEDFYNSHWRLLYSTAFSKTGDHDDSMDIVQDLFIHLWENRNAIHINGSVEGYLLISLRNRIFNHYRNRGTREKVTADYTRFVEVLVSHKFEFIEDQATRSMAEEAVRTAVDQLPEKMKYILVQNKYHHKTIQQLADELNIAPQTVKNQLTKALHYIERIIRQAHAKDITFLLLLFLGQPPGNPI